MLQSYFKKTWVSLATAGLLVAGGAFMAGCGDGGGSSPSAEVESINFELSQDSRSLLAFISFGAELGLFDVETIGTSRAADWAKTTRAVSYRVNAVDLTEKISGISLEAYKIFGSDPEIIRVLNTAETAAHLAGNADLLTDVWLSWPISWH